MDEKLRKAERSKESVRVLCERLRAGNLTKDHVELAARLGHVDARTLFPEIKLVDWSNQASCVSAIESAAALLGQTLPARVAADWAERSLPTWETRHPTDRRPHDALAAARAWVGDPCEKLREAAAEAGFAADDAARDAQPGPWKISPASYASAVAMAASDPSQAEAVAAGFAAHATWTEPATAAFDAAISASAAATNAKSPQAEREWQRLRLADLVLEQADG